uniref:Uncharacterized protein n=1 Tax=Romanomermis culicivorax TaxID=13658 RepID=A0A915JLH4_ROMCU
MHSIRSSFFSLQLRPRIAHTLPRSAFERLKEANITSTYFCSSEGVSFDDFSTSFSSISVSILSSLSTTVTSSFFSGFATAALVVSSGSGDSFSVNLVGSTFVATDSAGVLSSSALQVSSGSIMVPLGSTTLVSGAAGASFLPGEASLEEDSVVAACDSARSARRSTQEPAPRYVALAGVRQFAPTILLLLQATLNAMMCIVKINYSWLAPNHARSLRPKGLNVLSATDGFVKKLTDDFDDEADFICQPSFAQKDD